MELLQRDKNGNKKSELVSIFLFFLEASRKSEAQVPTILKRQVVNKHLETVT